MTAAEHGSQNVSIDKDQTEPEHESLAAKIDRIVPTPVKIGAIAIIGVAAIYHAWKTGDFLT